MPNDEQLYDYMKDQFEQVHRRLDQHYDLFQRHTDEDRKLGDRLTTLDKELTFAKGVTYAVNTITAGVVGFLGWSK